MHSHLSRFLRQSGRALLPALIFFLTGALVVQRQSRGYKMEIELDSIADLVQTHEARRHALDQEITALRTRERLAEEASRIAGLRQPTGPEIIILRLRAPTGAQVP